MSSTTTLPASLLRTYNAIFQHPVSHNLEWRHVHALFRHLGEVAEERNGNLKVTRNGQSLILNPPRTKDVATTEELMALRHFLERSERANPVADEKATRWLLVIDHHVARLFRSEMHGAVPQQFLPHEPDENFRHAQNPSRATDKTDPKSFFEPVAKVLQGSSQFLILGAGTGKSSEMDQFTAWLNQHHPELATRCVGALVVDENHLTDGQLLGKAREFYAELAGALP